MSALPPSPPTSPGPGRPAGSPPSCPPYLEELALARVLRATLFRRALGRPPTPPPSGLAPFEPLRIERARSGGALDAVHFPVPDAKGCVVLAHPAVPEGKGHFWRGPHLPALRSAGWSVLAFDGSGFGASARPVGLPHWDVAGVLGWARARYDRLAWWGVGEGGYWLHHAASRADAVPVEALVWEGACADVLSQLRVAPLARRSFPNAAAFIPALAHAPFLRARRALYVDGAAGPGSARRLAEAAREGGCLAEGREAGPCLEQGLRLLDAR